MAIVPLMVLWSWRISVMSISRSCLGDLAFPRCFPVHLWSGEHSFELGQGTTGGIMDYGDGQLLFGGNSLENADPEAIVPLGLEQFVR